MKNKKIGIVSLGIMGRGMADNFLKNGYEVYVWNRITQVAKDFEVKGAIVCSSTAQVAQQADGMNLEKVSEGLTDRPGGVITQIAKDAYFADQDWAAVNRLVD